MDFRPLFIAPALLCLDTVFNVDKQRYAALLFGSFRRLCALACNPFFDCFLCIADGEKVYLDFEKVMIFDRE